MKILYLIDVSSFIFRAFYAVRELNSKITGEPVNAVYGVATMLARTLKGFDGKGVHYAAVTFDSKESSTRKEIYAEYKANRSAPPEALLPQFDRIEQLIKAMRVPSFRRSGIEADDLIGTLAKDWTAQGADHHVVIVTGDKDLMQLVNDQVLVWDTMKEAIIRSPEVEAKFGGIRPDQVRDFLALVGDSSDNIPGVQGIGPKSATDLLKEHGTLEGVLKAAEEGRIAGKRGQTLKEERDLALLSQRLATLHDVEGISVTAQPLNYEPCWNADLDALFTELSFSSLKEKWMNEIAATAAQKDAMGTGPRAFETGTMTLPGFSAQQSSAIGTPASAEGVEFIAVTDEKTFQSVLAQIEKSPEFGFDLETTSLNPRQAQIVGVALAFDSARGYYIPVGHTGAGSEGQLSREMVLAKLRPYLENPKFKKIGQNLKYDWSVLYCHGLKPDGIGADTMVASYVYDPDGRHNMEVLAQKYLNYAVVTYEQVCGKGKAQIGFDQVSVELATRYSAEDAWITLKLWNHLRPLLHESGSMQVFAEVDLPLVDVLARMELEGIEVDMDWLKELSVRFQIELTAIEKKVQAYSEKFSPEPVNLNSPKQLAVLLFDQLGLKPQSKTKTGYSTDASVLEALAGDHEVPRLLLEYREVAKLKGTYVDPIPELLDAKTGRVHTSFHQAVAATGRLSCSDPNLQNSPIRSERGRLIRRAFVPKKGCVFLSADYSQIELRILAHLSQDKELVNSFVTGEDVHARTASEIYEIPVDQVTDTQRSVAKAINFGLMYGKTAFGLAQELDISRSEAKQTIDRYFARYSGVKAYLDSQIELAREAGETRTVLGRRRFLRDIKSKNPMMRAMSERMAMNTPIQGTAADLMKLAMIVVDERLIAEKLKSKILVQVHDELLLECPIDEISASTKLVCSAMENAMKLSVPLTVNCSEGKNWMDI